MIESAVTLLPQPDSPTSPSASPRSTYRDTPLTALAIPSRVKNWVWRSLTSSRWPDSGTGTRLRWEASQAEPARLNWRLGAR